MTGPRIAIVGAGIGGLTAALALAGEADEITIFERRTGFGETGAGIQLSPNASRVLVGLGLEGAIRRIGTRPDRIVVRGLRHGREIGTVGLAGAEERFGAPYLHVARSDLHTALLDAVRMHPNLRLRVGRGLASVADGNDRIELGLETNAGGRETAGADLLVGADGVRSRTRALLGDTRPLRYSGLAAYRAVVAAENVPESLARDGGLWLGPGRHVVHYPIGGGRLVNIVAVTPRRDTVEDWSAPAELRVLQGALGRMADPLARLVEAPGTWTAWSLLDLPARRMASGRAALLGDAAHPTLPFLAQGGALAIEDAAVLADAVRSHRADLRAALATYANARIGRVTRAQSAARRSGRAYHASGPVALVRNRVIAHLGPTGMLDRQAWLYAWRPDSG